MRSFDRWRALTASEQWLTVKSAVLICSAAASLRLLGLKRTLRITDLDELSAVPARLSDQMSKTVIADVTSAADRAERYAPGGSCLSKSVALAWMLRRRGVPAEIRIGVRTAGEFEAHAWVEASGLESKNQARFTPLV
jgi:hypothetical protein